jgi:DNA polymerase-4
MPNDLAKFSHHFNDDRPTLLHLDLNSCFATVEQQANPFLRGKPIAVAAYDSPGSFLLAPSIEAKSYGIKMGMTVREARQIYPKLIVLEPDPWKYRNVHLALKKLLASYTQDVTPKSIDEFVLNLKDYPSYKLGMVEIAKDIKRRIKSEIGEWLTVSVGISTNRYLAKIGASLHKPDGLDTIDSSNFLAAFSRLELTDLTGIKNQNAKRLNKHGIFTVLDFYNASPMRLQQAFHSITGHYWYVRLHGYEIDSVPHQRRSYSNSVALGKKLVTPIELSPILANLVEKMSARMRKAGYFAQGIHVSLVYKRPQFDNQDRANPPINLWSITGSNRYWHKGMTTDHYLFSPEDIYKSAYHLLTKAPHTLPVHIIAVTCFDLKTEDKLQQDLFGGVKRKLFVTKAIDAINSKWGDFVVKPAKMLPAQGTVKDRIAFGGVKELEEIVDL